MNTYRPNPPARPSAPVPQPAAGSGCRRPTNQPTTKPPEAPAEGGAFTIGGNMTGTFDQAANEKKICVVMSLINISSEHKVMDSSLGVILCALLLEMAQHPLDSFDKFIEHAKSLRFENLMRENTVN
jgi:hypothetical protein